MFAHIKKYAGTEIKAWAIVSDYSPATQRWWVERVIVQWGGINKWDKTDLDDAYLEKTDGDQFTLFKAEDKRVPAKIVAEFMRRALLGES